MKSWMSGTSSPSISTGDSQALPEGSALRISRDIEQHESVARIGGPMGLTELLDEMEARHLASGAGSYDELLEVWFYRVMKLGEGTKAYDKAWQRFWARGLVPF